jgi:acyl-CoA thioester hydrolase
VHERRIQIRWRDMDGFRHVNNAVFLTYLEECRDAFMADALRGVGELDDFVLARVAIDYVRQLRQDDGAVVVRCGLEGIGRSSVRTHEEILTDGGERAARAESVMVPLGPDGAARPLTDAERAAFEARLEPAP